MYKAEVKAVRDLMAAMLIQAAKDYFAWEEKPKKQATVIEDLNSKRWDFLTEGRSKRLAHELETRPEEVKKILDNGVTILN